MDQLLPYRPSTGIGARSRLNVGPADRLLSVVFAASLGRRALHTHKALPKMLAIAAGVIVAKKALTGRSSLYRALGVSSASLEKGAGIDIDTAITIMRPREELYEFWSDLTNLPLVFRHIEAIDESGPDVTHWRVKGPAGTHAEWDARLINHVVGERIAWESLPGSKVQNAGSIHFHDAGEKGTEVLVRMRYVPPGMAYGFGVAKLLNPATKAEVAEDLRRLKHLMETGIDISAEGQPSGDHRRDAR